MVEAVRQTGTVRARWVVCDEAFGCETRVLDRLDTCGWWYLAEVPHDTRVWPQRPAPGMPSWTGQGRPPARRRVLAGEAAPATVAQLAALLPAAHWTRQTIAGDQGGEQEARGRQLWGHMHDRGAGGVAGARGVGCVAAQPADRRAENVPA